MRFSSCWCLGSPRVQVLCWFSRLARLHALVLGGPPTPPSSAVLGFFVLEWRPAYISASTASWVWGPGGFWRQGRLSTAAAGKGPYGRSACWGAGSGFGTGRVCLIAVKAEHGSCAPSHCGALRHCNPVCLGLAITHLSVCDSQESM
jgi:hypothetical protein